jgi:FG-GAP-like repeat/FG-GAP repeat
MPLTSSWKSIAWLLLVACAATHSFAAAFGKQKQYVAGTHPHSVALADFNHDGNLDMAVADDNNEVSVLLGDGKGGFGHAVKYPVGEGTFLIDIAVGDFNEDGNPDIAVTVSDVGSSGASIGLLFGNGNGTFQPAKYVSSGNSPLALAVADFNGDHHLDLWVGGNGNSSVLLGNGDGTFRKPVTYTVESASFGVALADFNGDGRLDAAVTSDGENSVYIFLGNGDGTFHFAEQVSAAAQSPTAVVAADFNGDGRVDLAIADSLSNAVTILPGNGNGTFGAPYLAFAGYSPDHVATADINGDGKLDLVVSSFGPNGGPGGVYLLLGEGDGTFAFPTYFAAGLNPTGVAIGLIDANQSPDIAVSAYGSDTVSVLLNTTQ